MRKKIKILIVLAIVLVFCSTAIAIFLKFNIYLSKQQEKELKSQELLLAQQKELENTRQQIENLRKETEEKIKSETLKNQKAIAKNNEVLQEQITNSTKTLSNDLVPIIQEWRPRVAYITCVLRDASIISGSGLVAIFGESYPQVLTNKHVVRDGYGNVPPGCVVKLPDNDEIFEMTKSDDIPVSEIVDAGALNIRNPNSQLENLVSSPVKYCFPLGYTGKAAIGEPIVILGYPYTGSKYDITATEGIISGYEGNYYITSAKVEHGNSGGIAILIKENCYLGIPTYVKIGTSETLARILDINDKSIFYNK